MRSLEEIYVEKCGIPSDINEHLPTLKKLGEECETITEMGVRWVVSTYALMSAKPKKLTSIDIVPLEQYGNNASDLEKLASENGVEFKFVLGDTTNIEIEETDLLFIDTWHVYEQVKKELELHANKVKKYIAFHDTVTFGEHGEGGKHRGLMPAINEFLDENPEWYIYRVYNNNNGLLILKRSK